jgi:3-hydroxyisobutyrate dehydrogenase/glyoxylate/succinic semialdehyde reductase
MNGTISGKSAVLGLGIIGSRAADRISSAGCELATWSRSPRGRADECASATEAVRGAVRISFFLKDGQAVRGVMDEVGGVLRAGQVVMNHSTIDLATTLWLRDMCGEKGCLFLDAPFTGSKVAAEMGGLVYYIGGDEELAGEVDDYLALTSRMRVRCGEAGAATVVKLATNLISACSVQAMAEGLALATRHGVEAGDFIRAVSVNASSSPLAMMKMPAMAAGDYDTHFSLDNMAKDGRYACQLAEMAGLALPGISAVTKRMTQLCEEGLADLDYSALGKPYLEEP